MKKCTYCGAVQSDDRKVCIDCGTRLGSPVSKDDEQATERAFSEKVEKLTPETDVFHVSLVNKIIGIAAIALIAALIVTMVITSGKLEALKSEHPVDEFPFSDAYNATSARKSELNIAGAMAFGGIIMYAFSAFILLLPRVVWALDSARYTRWYKIDADIEPSDLYLIVHKLAGYAFFVIACILFAAAISHLI